MTVVQIENGDLEFLPSPDHVNVVAELDEEGIEVRLTEEQRDRLVKGLRADEEVNIELEDGVIAWEPKRGLYVEDFGTADAYAILSPEQREQVAEALGDTQVGV
jgi:hypothetical protein